MDNSLISQIVSISEKRFPFTRNRQWINSKPVILSCHEASFCTLVDAWLIVTSVAIPIENKPSKYYVMMEKKYISYIKCKSCYLIFK